MIKIYLYLIIFNYFRQAFFLDFLIFKHDNKHMGEKKIFSNRIDEDLIKALKHLSIDQKKLLGPLLEEAIQDLLKKYEIQPEKPN